MRAGKIAACIALAFRAAVAALVSTAGETAVIPSWDLQSTAKVGDNLAALSRTGVDTASWHHVNASKCTLMGCLIESGVYDETDLFYSDNLRRVDAKQFSVPWLYRNEFSLEPATGRHFILQTHGISSRADIYLNGQRVADRALQAGAYAGYSYDITSIMAKSNALLIQAHPTSYYYDFAIGWVDWNPWPADNGTGVWRDVELKQTGAVAITPLRVVTELGSPVGSRPANVTLKAIARNLEDTAVTVVASGSIAPTVGSLSPITWNKTLTLPPHSTVDIVLTTVVEEPRLWWPRYWGEQNLYSASLTVSTSDGAVSDKTSTTFGFRTVTSRLNSYNDTTFYVNEKPFQVVGGGYAPNMFLRWDAAKWETELLYALDIGMNTVRLEGKNEHPEAYHIADRLGVMIMAGWECCDKWEAWSYNQDLAVPTPVWNNSDYSIANASMRHEAAMLQTHPSVLAYLIGSDYWTDERATPIYLDALRWADWQVPVIGSASKRGYSPLTGPGGMKMEGPYDWVPPNYWWDTKPYANRYGAAFGFSSELSAGVGTPELSSLVKFLSAPDLDDLWKNPNKDLFHMSRETSQFHNRAIYNKALWARWGAPTSLEDYVLKTQISDYEATRAQFEAYASMWNASRPATGVIYWMLNGAFPSLHWSLWDYYMLPGGAYFGAKIGSRLEHVAFDYVNRDVYVINRYDGEYAPGGPRLVSVEIVSAATGKRLHSQTISVDNQPNGSKKVLSLASVLSGINELVFLHLQLLHPRHADNISRNVYWLTPRVDTLAWSSSDWYVTPVSRYADHSALMKLPTAMVMTVPRHRRDDKAVLVNLGNFSEFVAFFISLALVDEDGNDVVPVVWEDNYITLFPGESIVITGWTTSEVPVASVRIRGVNVQGRIVKVDE